MLKRAALILLLIVIFGVMVVFSYLNTGEVEVNLAFVSVTTSISIAFTVTLVVGWLFGVVSMGFFALRLVNERRTNANNLTGTAIEGGTPRDLAKGDFVVVPENTPHWFSAVNGSIILMTMHVPRTVGSPH